MEDLKSLIVDVPDFPKAGVIFKDITPILQDARAFNQVIDQISEISRRYSPEKVAAVESRGFIFGAALARELKTGLTLIRKKGKLPRKTLTVRAPNEYAVEYFEAHLDSVKQGERVVIVDDLIATGSSAISAIQLIQELGGLVLSFVALVELTALQGVKKINEAHPEVPVFSLLKL